MAQVERSTNGTSNGDGPKGKSGGTAPVPARQGLLSRVRGTLVNRSGQGANGTQPKRGQTFQFFFGLILFMLGSQVLLTVLSFLGSALHAQAFLSSTLAPKNQGILLLSGLSWFELFWFALVALFYYALVKTKLLPTDPFGTKARARDQAAQRSSTRSTASKAGGSRANTVTTVNVRPVTRADRRAAAQERAAQEAAAAAKNTKRAKSGQATVTQTQPQPAARSGEFDSAYERARAAQRQMRRRVAKR